LTVPVVDLINDKGYTALHQACFKNFEDIAKVIIEHVKETITQHQLTEWVNQKTEDDGFTALHFASFRGNVALIDVLLEIKADMYARNNYGINVMHVAA
jgi:palmitoyltransferase ZDHHC13/17